MKSWQKVIKYCAMAYAVLLSVSIIGGICSALGMVFVFFDGSKSAAGKMQTYTVSSEVEKLDVDISMATLEIIEGENFSVESNDKYLTVKENNGTLQISEEKESFGLSSERAAIVLTVPEGFVFDKAVISAGAGEVGIDFLSANTLDLDLGAGETTIGCLNVFTQAEINSGAGELTIQDGELNDLSMDLGVGEMELTGKLTGECLINYGIGEARLNLSGGREDYQIELDKGIGSATLDGETMSGDSVYGDGPNRISIDGGIGSIRIQFNAGAESLLP